MVTNDRRGTPVEAADAVKEGMCHGGGCVRMAERDKVHILGEAVDHHENDRLVAHLGKACGQKVVRRAYVKEREESLAVDHHRQQHGLLCPNAVSAWRETTKALA
jgi:hypothetical protein